MMPSGICLLIYLAVNYKTPQLFYIGHSVMYQKLVNYFTVLELFLQTSSQIIAYIIMSSVGKGT